MFIGPGWSWLVGPGWLGLVSWAWLVGPGWLYHWQHMYRLNLSHEGDVFWFSLFPFLEDDSGIKEVE